MKAPAVWTEGTTVNWEQVSNGAPSITLIPDAANPTLVKFTPPESEQEIEYKFEAEVTISEVDAAELTTIHEVVAKVPPTSALQDNRPPVAVAGEYKTAHVGETVILNAGNSYDPDCPDRGCLTFSWAQVVEIRFGDGSQGALTPPVDLFNADKEGAGFMAAEAGNFLFEVVVSDGLYSVSHTLVVAVLLVSECCDGNPCPLGLRCNCESGDCAVLRCSDNDTCTTDKIVDGECMSVPIACDDGNLCTDDECREGTCSFEPEECGPGMICDPQTGDCVFPPPPCEPANCDDANACTDDSCQSGQCQNVNNSAPCDDGSFCTATDMCSAGSCLGSGSPCGDGPCDEENDKCECNDNDLCTNDAIVEGACVYTPIDCDDEDPCTDDRCDNGNCIHDEPANACLVAKWRDSTAPVNVDIGWELPNGTQPTITRCGPQIGCSESACLPRQTIPDGLHCVTVDVHGNGQTTGITPSVRFPGYCFEDSALVLGPEGWTLCMEVNDGIAQPVFNDWRPPTDPEWIRVTGIPNLEFIGGWQQAPDNVNVDLSLTVPSGDQASVQKRSGSQQHGLERIILPGEVALADGTYRAEFELRGDGRTADAAMILRVGEVHLRYEGLYIGPMHRVIGLDVTGGTARTVFNSWVDGVDPSGGALTGIHVAEINCGWRDAVENVNANIELRLPSRDRVGVSRAGPDLQGFERILLPAGTPLPDGTYTLEFEIAGRGRQSNITYQAMLANWTFEVVDSPMIGGTAHTITLDVRDGVATEVSNSWR